MDIDNAPAIGGRRRPALHRSVLLIDVYPTSDDVLQATDRGHAVDVVACRDAGHQQGRARSRLTAQPGLLRAAAFCAAAVLAFALGRAQADLDERTAPSPGGGTAARQLWAGTGGPGIGEEVQEEKHARIRTR